MQTNKISLNNSAYLTSYLCDDYRVDVAPAARPAVIICPGGGWMFLSEREGEPIAIEFARRGYVAFVLHYSVSDKKAEPGDFSLIYRALDEIETAYDHLMDMADDNIVDRRKISVMGFSAGGQLAALFSSRHAELLSSILCYPLLDIADETDFINSPLCPPENRELMEKCLSCTGLSELSGDEWHSIDPVANISCNMPRTFIWHGALDNLVRATGSMNYLHRLLDKGIRAELHIYDNCGHGISLGTRETAAVADEINEYGSVWFDQLMRWMEELIR